MTTDETRLRCCERLSGASSLKRGAFHEKRYVKFNHPHFSLSIFGVIYTSKYNCDAICGQTPGPNLPKCYIITGIGAVLIIKVEWRWLIKERILLHKSAAASHDDALLYWFRASTKKSLKMCVFTNKVTVDFSFLQQGHARCIFTRLITIHENFKFSHAPRKQTFSISSQCLFYYSFFAVKFSSIDSYV